jgi:hypothetical protein
VHTRLTYRASPFLFFSRRSSRARSVAARVRARSPPQVWRRTAVKSASIELCVMEAHACVPVRRRCGAACCRSSHI